MTAKELRLILMLKLGFRLLGSEFKDTLAFVQIMRELKAAHSQ